MAKKQHTRDLLQAMIGDETPSGMPKPEKSALVPVNMRLRASDYELLKAWAESQGISTSGAFRMALARFLEAEGVRR